EITVHDHLDDVTEWWRGNFDAADHERFIKHQQDSISSPRACFVKLDGLNNRFDGPSDRVARVCAIGVSHTNNQNLCVLDFEMARQDESAMEVSSLSETVQNVTREINKSRTTKEVAQSMVEQVQSLCKFDRVMMLKFLDDGAGEIVAEATCEGFNQSKHKLFQGFKFPRVDVPEQARKISLKYALRFIHDTHSEAVPMVPAVVWGAPVDVTASELRSPSPMHAQYLCNMKVKGSLTCSIVNADGNLWGYMTCHNYDSKMDMGVMVRTIATVVTSVGQCVINTVELQENRHIRSRVATLLKPLWTITDPPQWIALAAPKLMEHVQCDSILLVTYDLDEHQDGGTGIDQNDRAQSQDEISLRRNATHTFGAPVNENLVCEVLDAMCASSTQDFNAVLSTSCVKKSCPAVFEKFRDCDLVQVCGVAIAKCFVYDLVFVRKQELINDIWAGTDNPHKAAGSATTADAPAPRLLPRSSFQEFNKAVHFHSIPWSGEDLHVTESVRYHLASAAERTMVNQYRVSKRASRNTSQFLASMSHELRTPFNGIVGMVSCMLQDEDLTSEMREMVETINVSSLAMLRILDDILTAAKMDSGEFEIHKVEFFPAELVNSCCRLFKVECMSRQVRVRANLEHCNDATVVHGDPGRVRQILLNLIGNAVKFSEDDGSGEINVTLRILESSETVRSTIKASQMAHKHTTLKSPSLQEVGEEEQWILVSVDDNGRGINETNIGKLFRRFSQVDEASPEVSKGTGLGLAISAKLCELMKGKAWCNSTEGKGSSFQFCVPVTMPKTEPTSRLSVKRSSAQLAKDGAENGDAQNRRNQESRHVKVRKMAVDQPEQHEERKQPRHVVIGVDDSPVNRVMMVELLMLEDPNQVASVFEKHKADTLCLLVDLQMPEKDGFGVARDVRRICNTVPIFLVTASIIGDPRLAGFSENARVDGVDGVVYKPITGGQLRELIFQEGKPDR
ncbi:Phytochrome-like protein Cph1 (Bacteriophytochrome Cph1) (Light-regulated histidine kinase 1), partial [Durusdinium trenchii]